MDVSSTDYVPRDGGLFRGFFCTADGNVVIKDVDDVSTTFPVVAGNHYSYGGKQINKTSTTATVIAILDNN